MRKALWMVVAAAAAGGFLAAPPASADICYVDDLIVDGSLCVGFDCTCNYSFGFDTIVLKENNLRIFFDDTSTAGGFPTNNWRIVINDSASGGASYFGVEDSNAGRRVFTLEAGAPSHSLYVDDGGRLGLGTSTPVVDIHAVSGNTPTLRLDQNGSSGFSPQVWDVAGNETNFFVRDVTNGSQLPFRIRPGADSNSIYIDADNDVIMGSSSNKQLGGNGGGTDVALAVVRSNGEASILVEETSTSVAQRFLMELRNNGAVQTKLNNTDSGVVWRFGVNNANDFVINDEGDVGTAELKITQAGDLFVNNVGPMTVPDYVFDPDYELMPLGDLAEFVAARKHLPGVASKDDVVEQGGINLSRLPLQLLEKVEELTLYTLAQQREIEELRARLSELEDPIR